MTLAGAGARTQDAERVLLTAGRSTVLLTDFDITRIAVTNPAIADAVVVRPREVLVDGKGAGTVSLIVWGDRHPQALRRRRGLGCQHPAAELPAAVPRREHQRRGHRRCGDPLRRSLEQRGDAAGRGSRPGRVLQGIGRQHAAAARRLAEQAGDAAGALCRGQSQRAAAGRDHAVHHARGVHVAEHDAAVPGAELRRRGVVAAPVAAVSATCCSATSSTSSSSIAKKASAPC